MLISCINCFMGNNYNWRSGIRPGDVQWGPQSGFALLARAGIVGIDHLVFTEEVIRTATVSKSAVITYLGKSVAIVTSLGWSDSHRGLVAYFRWTSPVPQVPPTQVISTGVYKTQGLICPACQSTLLPNASPCNCIYQAESLYIPKIHLLSVTFWDGKHDDVSRADCRDTVLTKHFGGAVTDLDYIVPL